MTEYEIADLAASRAFEIQGVWSLLQTQMSMVTDILQQYMSILFGYIVAAYLIGANLSRRQVWIFTTLYIMWQVWMIMIMIGRSVLTAQFAENLRELVDTTTPLTTTIPVFIVTSSALLAAALFASLYFMWSIRHPRTE